MITATAEANESLKISAPVGTTIPLFAGAAGKVLLAQESNESLLQLIARRGLPRFTPNSIVAVEEYLSDLNRVRSRGYAVDDEEYLSGIRAIAVALNNRRGLPMAIWVVGIASNMKLEELPDVATIMAVAASTLCSQLEESGNAGIRSVLTSRKESRRIPFGSEGQEALALSTQ
jgi:DNA-binding IclR family transcriptional regulator